MKTILGDGFGNLFEVVWEAIKWIGKQIGSFFKWLGELIWEVIKWIGKVITSLFEALFDLLLTFFEFIYALVDALLYFIWSIGLLAAKVFHVFLEVGKLIYSFVVGFARTLSSLSYSTQGSGGHGYSDMVGRVFRALQPLQLDIIAYVLMFAVWIFTAITIIKLLASIRVGGE